MQILDLKLNKYEYLKLWVAVGGHNFNSYCAGIDFRRKILTSVDVRIWRLKSIPAL